MMTLSRAAQVVEECNAASYVFAFSPGTATAQALLDMPFREMCKEEDF
jgi:hypothetical protein